MPFAQKITIWRQKGAPQKLSSYDQLDGCEGFVMAPFNPSPECHIQLLHPDEIEITALSDFASEAVEPASAMHGIPTGTAEERRSYADQFRTFHRQLCDGTFRKLVLARMSVAKKPADMSVEQLFVHACRMYPRQTVLLFSSRASGTWLMATPEVLLEGDGTRWNTMALAGTMRYDGDAPQWSAKNRQEQDIVAQYIRETLKRHASAITASEPFTTRAADLIHLRTDFTFALPDNNHIGQLLTDLHPTPAVCGLPKDDARRFILDNEAVPREYYSGFIGPLSPGGATHLYVSLRCMKITDDQCHLYAGGGLLKESDEENEWQETEAKLMTMRQLLSPLSDGSQKA